MPLSDRANAFLCVATVGVSLTTSVLLLAIIVAGYGESRLLWVAVLVNTIVVQGTAFLWNRTFKQRRGPESERMGPIGMVSAAGRYLRHNPGSAH